jgi:ferredoxin
LNHSAPAPVFFFPMDGGAGPELDHALIAGATAKLVSRLQLSVASGSRWGVRVQLGAPGRPPEIDPRWVTAAAAALGGAAHVPFDTLSITQEGLHTVATHLKTAQAKGYGPDYGVADETDRADGGSPLAALAAELQGLLLLGSVAPHPHLGFLGAVAGLGLGLSDRQGKLDLHRDIRPRVDTPLCAGCGSCLAVCIFDAIEIRAGRAFIDHTRCTGCGECMTVCHMAGIAPEDQARIPVFQQKVAETAADFSRQAAWGRPGRSGYVNYLLNVNRWQNRSRNRLEGRPRHLGILASADPVAADRAAWDLLAAAWDGNLAAWSGYRQIPGDLLERAAEKGLGSQEYRLVTLD